MKIPGNTVRVGDLTKLCYHSRANTRTHAATDAATVATTIAATVSHSAVAATVAAMVAAIVASCMTMLGVLRKPTLRSLPQHV